MYASLGAAIVLSCQQADKIFSQDFCSRALHGGSLDSNIELGTVDMKVVEEMPFLAQIRVSIT